MKATDLMIGDWGGRVFNDKRIIEDYRQADQIRTGEIGMRYQVAFLVDNRFFEHKASRCDKAFRKAMEEDNGQD